MNDLLDALRVALGAYLRQLRRAWSGDGARDGDRSRDGDRDADGHGDGHRDGIGPGDVERLLAGVGARPQPTRAERTAVSRALARGTGGPLAAALGLDPGEELVLAAATWAEADPQFAVVLGCAHDDGTRRYPTATLLRLLLEPFGLAMPVSVDETGPLVRSGLLLPGAGATGPLTPTPTARLVLHGGALEPFRPPGPLPARLAPVVGALARHWATPGRPPVLLRGPAGSGRRALAAAAAARAGLHAVPADRPAPELRLLSRVAGAVPIVPADLAAGLDWTVDDGPLCAWTDASEPGTSAAGEAVERLGAYVVDIGSPGPHERASSWARGLARADLPDGRAASLAPTLASRFAFTEGDIEGALDRAVLDAAWHGRPVDEDVVWAAARRQPQHALGRLATLVAPAFTLDDLVVAPGTRDQLDALVAHVALQHVVLDGWGFRRRLPRGQGVAALFTGPPGTGKTMAAEAVAARLHQDLYRIDLSAVVSKYIGETEKNLAVAFDAAERAGAVLFFDEADSLFGKRTEVRDAHDRYANLEVNYLLQRVEVFTGLVLLATNRRAALDEAFVRRLRFIIRFELPDRALRRELWQRAFPADGPLDEGTDAPDWDALAAGELSGGSIQTVALHAAFQAAAGEQRIGIGHLETALRREYDKLGKAFPGLPGRRATAGAAR